MSDIVEILEDQVIVSVDETRIDVVTVGIQGPAGTAGGGGVTDHGALTGLGDDDHLQYHTDARGDARYYLKADVDTALAGKQNSGAYETTTQLNARDVANRARANHTGTQTADSITDGTTNKSYTAVEKTKLAGIAAGATVNASDAALRDRSTHTGTQASSSISDFSTASDARIAAASGVTVASLSGGKIPTGQLPAIALVDVRTVSSQAAQLALTAQQGDVAIRTDLNKSFVQNGGSAGTMADWSELLTPTDQVLSVNGNTGVVTVNKADVGLGSVDNTSDLSKPISTAAQSALNGKVATSDSRLTDTRTPTDGTVSTIKIIDNAVTSPKLSAAVQTSLGKADTALQSAPVTSVATKTGAVSLDKTDVGLASVDNTSDASKPVSTATQTALNAKADLVSPTFTGAPSGPTATAGTTTTQLATTAFVGVALSGKQNTISLTTTGTSGAATFNSTTGALNIPQYAGGGGGGTVTSVTSATADATVATTTSTPVITIVSAPKLTTGRNINGVAFDGTANITVADATKEPAITAGTTAQYFRGDKSFQTLDKTAVGLANVDNTSDSTKNAATAVLTNKDVSSATNTFPTFNQNTTGSAAKLTTGRTIAVTGDISYTSPSFDGSANVTAAATLPTVNSNVGSFGSATQVPVITANAKGQVTAASNTSIQIAESQVTNLVTDLGAKLSNITGLVTAGTNVTLTGAGTSASPYVVASSGSGGSLPTQSGNARKILVTDGTAASWQFDQSNMTTFTVAASNANALDKAVANYLCDGTADDVEINQALQAAKAAGGIVKLSAGTFNIAAPLYIEGNNSPENTPAIALIGAGVEATNLVGASGVSVITLRYMPKPKVHDLCITVTGAADGIYAIANTTGSNDRRGFWHGDFQNLFVKGSSHTGWVLNLENPFRSYFRNIQTGVGIKNGIWMKSNNPSFNPGNSVFEVCQMGLSVANGIGYRMTSADAGGFLNIATFIECDCIDTAASTTSIGWLFEGSTTSYFTTRDMLVLRSNPEGFNTSVKLSHAANIEFIANFSNPKTGGKMYDVSSDSVNNYLSVLYLYVDGSSTINAITDLNTDANKPNYFTNSFARVETGGTLTITPSSVTRIHELARDSDGSGTYPSIWTPDYRRGPTTFANQLTASGGLSIADATDIALGTTTGTKIGTATTQKIGFFNATPVVQQGAAADIGGLLGNLGLRAPGASYTITTSGAVALGGGGFRSSSAARTANTTLSSTAAWNNLCNATTASFTITLPAANASSGQILWFMKIDSSANTVTISRAGTDTINGATTYVLSAQYKYVEIINDNTSSWYVKDAN